MTPTLAQALAPQTQWSSADTVVLCLLGAMFGAMFLWIHAPWGFRCGGCGRIGELQCKGFSIAGEGIVTDAMCPRCHRQMEVDAAGYIVTRMGFIRTTVPVRGAIPEDVVRAAEDFEAQAWREVEQIAPSDE